MVIESTTVNLQQVLRFIRANKSGRGQILKVLATEFTKEFVNQVQVALKPGKK